MRWNWRGSILGTLGWSIFQILLRILEIPGHIDDATTWLRWFRVIANLPIANPAIVIIGFIIFGPVLWMSPWWYPKVRAHFKRSENRPDVAQDEVQLFTELYPVIKLRAEKIKMDRTFIGIRELRRSWDSMSADSDIEYVRLVNNLRQLGIEYRRGVTAEKEHSFLIHLAARAKDGSLAEARMLWPYPSQAGSQNRTDNDEIVKKRNEDRGRRELEIRERIVELLPGLMMGLIALATIIVIRLT